MATTSREAYLGERIVLEVDIKDARGMRVDPDFPPTVSIVDAWDNIVVPRTNNGILRIEVGRFRYEYLIPQVAKTGVWIDHWQATVGRFVTDARLNFIVLSPAHQIDISGEKIGDPPHVTWSQEEIVGVNILIACLKNRLKNNLQVESVDAYGNQIFTNCSIFTDDELAWFLRCSLEEFNAMPHFTQFSFADQVIYERYGYVIVEGAWIIALAAQMLIEAGKEFSVNDNGVAFVPAPLSSTINNELSHFIGPHRENLKFIKACIKPRPIGFGGYRVLSSNPSLSKLRHLRDRRII